MQFVSEEEVFFGRSPVNPTAARATRQTPGYLDIADVGPEALQYFQDERLGELLGIAFKALGIDEHKLAAAK